MSYYIGTGGNATHFLVLFVPVWIQILKLAHNIWKGQLLALNITSGVTFPIFLVLA